MKQLLIIGLTCCAFGLAPKCGALSGADVFCRDGRGTCKRRRAGGCIRCGGARADWRSCRCSHWLHGRAVDFAFMGREPIKCAAPAAQRRTS